MPQWHHIALEICVNTGSGNGLMLDGTEPLHQVDLNTHDINPKSWVFGVHLITSFFSSDLKKKWYIIWVNIFNRIEYAHNGWSCDMHFSYSWSQYLSLSPQIWYVKSPWYKFGFAKFQYLYFSDIWIYFLINLGVHTWLFGVEVIFSIHVLWNLDSTGSAWINFDLSLVMYFVTFIWEHSHFSQADELTH